MVGDIGEWRPGFYIEFRCGRREHSGLAWGAFFLEKKHKFQDVLNLPTWTCLKLTEIIMFPEQKAVQG